MQCSAQGVTNWQGWAQAPGRASPRHTQASLPNSTSNHPHAAPSLPNGWLCYPRAAYHCTPESLMAVAGSSIGLGIRGSGPAASGPGRDAGQCPCPSQATRSHLWPSATCLIDSSPVSSGTAHHGLIGPVTAANVACDSVGLGYAPPRPGPCDYGCTLVHPRPTALTRPHLRQSPRE